MHKNKGRLQKYPIHPRAVEIAQKYDFKMARYSQQYFNKTVKVLAKRAGINTMIEFVYYVRKERITEMMPKYSKISTHTARRTFGYSYLKAGGSLLQLAELFGHSSTKTTKEYVGWEAEDLKLIVDRIKY